MVPGLAILEIIGYWLNQEFLVKTGKLARKFLVPGKVSVIGF